jgi:hypothetical protein
VKRGRRFWIVLIAWLVLGLPALIGAAWMRSDGLPIPAPPRFEKGITEVIGWGAVMLFVYAAPILLIIDELQFRRSNRAEVRKQNAAN